MKGSLSFWEKEVLIGHPNTVVIGGGIVGLSTAIHRKLYHPEEDIMVIERDAFGGGGSTKNAGFACFGSPSEILSDLSVLSEDQVIDLITERWKGLLKLRTLLGDQAIAYEPCGSVELFLPASAELAEKCVQQLDRLNAITQKACGEAVFEVRSQTELRSMYGPHPFTLGIANRLEGSIDTGKMFRNLLRLAEDKGIRIVNGLAVSGIEERSNGVSYQVRDQHLFCDRIFVCTNGFAREILPSLEVTPARNLVMVTEAIPDLKWRGTFHMEEGHIYFRNIGDRLLLGGARHLDPNWSASNEEVPVLVKEHLLHLLHEVLLPGVSPKITHEWTGYLGLGQHRQPIVERVSDHIAAGVKMGGMGVAIGTRIGERLSALL